MPRITKPQLDRLAELSTITAELSRRLSAFKAEAKQIISAAEADLASSGRELVTRAGYRITWKEGRLSVAWKEEFIERLGADIANQLTDAAPIKKTVHIAFPQDEKPAKPDAEPAAKPAKKTKPKPAAK